jgi:4-hydroxybenzoate polyprenyltransferase
VIPRARLLVVMTRPAVLVLLGLFAATGYAQAGGTRQWPLVVAVATVIGFLLFSVALNDLADEAIDRVNLAGDPSRPLVAGTAYRRDMATVGVTAGVVALATSAALGWPAVAVTAAGLALSAGYSLRPVRVADRGALASLLLPACFAAVPYLLGVFAARPGVRAGDLVVLAGLYVGFIGRILLKDFRDVRGDALFGKRTFLVRHGRHATCAVSACCWVAGTILLLTGVRPFGAALAAGYAVATVAAVWLLRELARDPGPRREERLVWTLAIVGRGMLVVLLAHLAMSQHGWPAPFAAVMIAGLVAVVAGQARTMLHDGPVTRGYIMPASGTPSSAGVAAPARSRSRSR